MKGQPALAGALGALLASVLMRAFREADLTRLNLELLTGSLMWGEEGPAAWRAGLLAHAALGAAGGYVYAGLFRLMRLSGPEIGMAVAAYHAVLTGVLLPVLDATHPRIREGDFPATGPFATELGLLASAILVASHLVYGAALGLLLPPVKEAARARPLTQIRR